MKSSVFAKGILGAMAGLTLMTSSALALACGKPHVRAHSPRVNTVVEQRFDYDHNGWIGTHERWAMVKARANTAREFRCDYNRNGFVDTRIERACL